MKISKLQGWLAVLALLMASVSGTVMPAADLEKEFRAPPASAQPWTLWFWMNGNITREGITADLEAMSRVGIRAAIVYDVARPGDMAPAGPAPFGSPAWRELFGHAAREAKRLGMELGMNNDAGWSGSGGPWNTPEYSMQKLVWTSTEVTGPRSWRGNLSRPEDFKGFYRDVRVQTFPKTEAGRRVAVAAVTDLTAKMDPAGNIAWDVPPGTWVVQRIGHTSNGQVNHPSPASGVGLECDKLSAEAMQRHFDGFIGPLAAEFGGGRTAFTMTHVDSWEAGVQDWTTRFPEEFRRRRGYDVIPWLVTLTGGAELETDELTRRFRRDFKRTQSELVNEAYAGTLRRLAHERGLRLSIEAYGPSGKFINSFDYAAQADVPMSEFWVARWGAWHLLSSRVVASYAHASGRQIVAAESFTARPENGSWTEHPYSIKTVGDWAFTQGVNRMAFHRAVLQPWSGNEPGMTFAGYGTHFDRNQTWWEPGKAFMRYLARCQYLLQQGEFVGDVCRLVPDGENHGSSPGMAALPERYLPLPVGYNYDYVPDTLLEGATVQNGRITLRSGMHYGVMQLPETREIAPEVLAQVRDLVRAGAVVVGRKPETSPSLSRYPECDAQVRAIAAELWGPADGGAVTEHRLGSGRVFWGRTMEEVLRLLKLAPDLRYEVTPAMTQDAIASVTLGRGIPHPREKFAVMPTDGMNWIHRRIDDAEVYFLANPQHRPVLARCGFRVGARQPELWDAETGTTVKPAVFVTKDGYTELTIPFTPAGSVFVVFREPASPGKQVVRVERDRPASNAAAPATDRRPSVVSDGRGIELITEAAGRYRLQFADGAAKSVEVPALPTGMSIAGPWQVRFQSGRGASADAQFAALRDWKEHDDDGIRHFSGTATYAAEFDWQPEPGGTVAWLLDLGRVEVIAEVTLNGVDLGVLWKPPFVRDVTRALKSGRNHLEVKITNTWVNRLVGDERYPDDCTADGTWKRGALRAWPEWFLKGQPRPEPRRITFTTFKYFTAETPLVSSGLIGPVVLRPEQHTPVR